MTVDEQIRHKKADADVAWGKYLQACHKAKDGESALERIRAETHANNRQELLMQVVAEVKLRSLQDMQTQLDAEAERAMRQSDEAEKALGELLIKRDAASQSPEHSE